MKLSEVETEQKLVKEQLENSRIVLAANTKIEIADFGLGRYRSEGLGIVVRINEPEYCSKWLTLLPRQECPEHYHKLKRRRSSVSRAMSR